MDEMAILGIAMVVVAVPGLLIGLALVTGKWAPAFKSADPDRVRKMVGLALLSTDALLLVAGGVLALTRI